MELKKELEEIFDIEDTTPEHLQDERKGPLIIKLYEKMKSEKSSTDLTLSSPYARSSFRHFESYLRILVGLEEDDIQLVFNQYNSFFLTYEIPAAVYSIEEISEALYTMADRGTLQIEYDDISMKTKLILSLFVMIRFNEKTILKRVLAFTPNWDYKPN